MTSFSMCVALGVAFVASQAGAQAAAPAPAAPLQGNWQQRDMTRQQSQQLADTMFQRLDANHDGVLTRQEADQGAAQMGDRGGGRAQRLIARTFGDAKSVSLAQFEALALARFDRQDVNHDGVVTADERQQGRAAREEGN